MSSAIQTIQRVYDRFQRSLLSLAGLAIIAIMILLTVKIVIRFSDITAVWLSGLSKVFLIGIVFVPLSYMRKDDQHLSVGFVYDRLPGRAQRALDYLALLIGLTIVSVVFQSALQAYGLFSGRTTSAGLPSGLVYVPAVAGFLLLTVEYVRCGLEMLKEDLW
jgi:TRAP-type C4-dicarboxylate transport system permease small subunit